MPNRITAADVVARQPSALILSGGPKSVNIEGSPRLDSAIYDLGVPILGICYGAQLVALQLGGEVGRGMRGEYGRTTLRRTAPSLLLPDEAPDSHDVWMSHFGRDHGGTPGVRGHGIHRQRPGRRARERRAAHLRRAVPSRGRPHPHGMAVLRRFLAERAGVHRRGRWRRSPTSQVARVREQIGDGRAICALSGGVDSAVASALVHRAIGRTG